MTWIAAGLLIVVVLFGLALYRQGVSHQEHVLRLDAEARAERSELLTRIQHPEVRYFPPVEMAAQEPPRDAGELAFVGQVVPDGYLVGTEAPIESANSQS